jgi:serine/threonine protein kinase
MAARQESSTSSGSRKSGSRAVVGQFNIGSEIGKGSFAQVYLGWHKVRQSFYPCFDLLLCHRTNLRCLFVPAASLGWLVRLLLLVPQVTEQFIVYFILNNH